MYRDEVQDFTQVGVVQGCGLSPAELVAVLLLEVRVD
jgi:hypothetical protein